MSTREMLLIPLMAAIYAIPALAVFHPKVRASHYIWVVGVLCTVTADILWIWLSKSLDNNNAIAHASFIWDLAYKVLIVAIPAIFFGVELSLLSYCGVSFLVVGGVLLKLGASAS